MVTRRRLLLGAVSALTATAGCVGSGDSDDGGTDERNDPADESSTAEAPSYHLRAAPVEADDLEAVLSTDESAVAALDALVELIVEVTESFEVVYRSISAEDAAAFEDLTADVERHYAGNPPGYYFEHEGRRVSVTLGGG
ncbi:MAG: hypothetical protein ACQET5_07690 [Halobacteriota archaeon]|uniref:hypothetical protein n=1 Tax=Natronomonas sp. TaxID=2184060 RepID=UPI0039764CC2